MKHKNAHMLINGLLKTTDEVGRVDTLVKGKTIYIDNATLFNTLFYLLDALSIDFDAYEPDDSNKSYRIDFTDSNGFDY